MVQERRGIVEHHDIHAIVMKERDQVRRQRRGVTEGRGWETIRVHVHSDVDVAVRLGVAARVRTEEVAVENLGPSLEEPGEDPGESLAS